MAEKTEEKTFSKMAEDLLAELNSLLDENTTTAIVIGGVALIAAIFIIRFDSPLSVLATGKVVL